MSPSADAGALNGALLTSSATTQHVYGATDDASSSASTTTRLDSKTVSKRHELACIMKMAGPMLCTQLLEWSLVFATSISVGHLGMRELSATQLANTALDFLATSFIMGIATSLDTYVICCVLRFDLILH